VMVFGLALGWTGRAVHESNLHALGDLKHSIIVHQTEEREAIYAAADALHTEGRMLEVVTSAEDLVSIQATGIPYYRALQFVTDAFVHSDELVQILLRPVENRRTTLQDQCTDEILVIRHKLSALSSIAHSIQNASATLDLINHQLTLSDAEKSAYHGALTLQAQQLMSLVSNDREEKVASSVQHQNADDMADFITQMQRIVANQTQTFQNRLAEIQSNCANETVNLENEIEKAHKQLALADVETNRLIRAFAHVAKQDVGLRIDSLTEIARFNTKIREQIKDLVDDTTELSETITLSICEDSCNGHGLCRSGVCMCDDKWSGETCATQKL